MKKLLVLFVALAFAGGAMAQNPMTDNATVQVNLNIGAFLEVIADPAPATVTPVYPTAAPWHITAQFNAGWTVVSNKIFNVALDMADGSDGGWYVSGQNGQMGPLYPADYNPGVWEEFECTVMGAWTMENGYGEKPAIVRLTATHQ